MDLSGSICGPSGTAALQCSHSRHTLHVHVFLLTVYGRSNLLFGLRGLTSDLVSLAADVNLSAPGVQIAMRAIYLKWFPQSFRACLVPRILVQFAATLLWIARAAVTGHQQASCQDEAHSQLPKLEAGYSPMELLQLSCTCACQCSKPLLPPVDQIKNLPSLGARCKLGKM